MNDQEKGWEGLSTFLGEQIENLKKCADFADAMVKEVKLRGKL